MLFLSQGIEEGLTQMCKCSNDPRNLAVWNFPLDITFKSTNPHGCEWRERKNYLHNIPHKEWNICKIVKVQKWFFCAFIPFYIFSLQSQMWNLSCRAATHHIDLRLGFFRSWRHQRIRSMSLASKNRTSREKVLFAHSSNAISRENMPSKSARKEIAISCNIYVLLIEQQTGY